MTPKLLADLAEVMEEQNKKAREKERDQEWAERIYDKFGECSDKANLMHEV